MPQPIPEQLLALMGRHFPSWRMIEQIGNGSYSRAYRIQEDGGKQAALKWIEYPEDTEGIAELRARGASEDAVREHRRHTLALLQQEIQLLEKLKENPNIVTLYGYAVEQREDGSFDLLILMELLQPLTSVIPQMTVGDVCRLGQDICKALAACERERIMHRDIKPANIFRTPDGTYQLGDFGVARRVAGKQLHATCGTPLYMAPEVNRGLSSYDHRVDIYSLGLVLYELLNDQCPPFVEGHDRPVTVEEEESSIKARLAGDPLPSPSQAPDELAKVILRACSFDPEDRFDSAAEMLEALQNADIGPRSGEKLRGLQNRPSYESSIQAEQDTASETRRALPRNTLPLAEQGNHRRAVKAKPEEDDRVEPAENGEMKETVVASDNPYIEIKRKKALKRKKIIRILIAVAAFAAVVVAAILLINNSKQMKALTYSQDGTLCGISWQDGGGGPWQVTAVSPEEKTTVYSAEITQRSAQIRLMPGQEYDVTVGDQPLKVSMKQLPEYSGEIRQKEASLMSYVIYAGSNIETVRKTPQTVIRYSKKIGEEGTDGFVVWLSYQYAPSSDTQPAEALCLIQYGNAITEQTLTLAPAQDGKDSYLLISLNEALKRGDVSGGLLRCSIYIQNRLWFEGIYDATRKD